MISRIPAALLFSALLLTLAGQTASAQIFVDAALSDVIPHPEDSAANSGGAIYLSARVFRQKYPAPPNLPALITNYDIASAILLEKAKGGLRTDVQLKETDGTSQSGYDEYFSSSPQRFREVRESHENIVVGDSNCAKKQGEAMKCAPIRWGADHDFGLRRLVPAAIVSVEESTVPCGADDCKSYLVTQGDAAVFNDDQLITANPEANHLTVTLVVRKDGAPFSTTEAQYRRGESVGPEARYIFSYDTQVVPFELPQQ